MATHDDFPSLPTRVSVLGINIAIFYLAYAIFSSQRIPDGGLDSVWLFSAAALWFLTLLSSPWFLPPRDGLVNAIGAVSILVSFSLTAVAQFQTQLNLIRWISVIYAVFVIVLSLIAFFLHDRDSGAPGTRLSYRLTGIFGKGEVLYTPAALISILGAYQSDYVAIASLIFLWTFFCSCSPSGETFVCHASLENGQFVVGGHPKCWCHRKN